MVGPIECMNARLITWTLTVKAASRMIIWNINVKRIALRENKENPPTTLRSDFLYFHIRILLVSRLGQITKFLLANKPTSNRGRSSPKDFERGLSHINRNTSFKRGAS